jgi:Do/DeqQ family serine protease
MPLAFTNFALRIFLLAVALPLSWAPTMALAQPASFATLVKAQRNKVVHINTGGEQRETQRGDPLPYPPPRHRNGLGSGFIVSPQGLIVTNKHVIAEARGIEVVLASGESYKAKVVGVDSRTDLALLKINRKNLPATRFGDSDKMEVGDWVVAIGNPLGLDYSVTAGIVSAKGRNIFDGDGLAYGEFIQTDAAINPGNSGGPLFNLKGDVIGVNTAISSRGYGIGFAVPSNIVVEVVRQLKLHGQVLRGWLGVVIRKITRKAGRAMGFSPSHAGVLVEESLPGGPAAAAGIKEGDVLTRFGGSDLRSVPHLQKLVAFSKPGGSIKVGGLRRAQGGGKWKAIEFTVSIASPPGQSPGAGESRLEHFGLFVGVPPDNLRRKLGLRPGVGVMVERITPWGRAAGLGLRKGDVIVQVDQQEVGSQAELGDLLNHARSAKVRLLVRRDRKVLYFVLTR